MPSKDPINPAANAWRTGHQAVSDPARRRATAAAGRPAPAAMSALVMRLAARLGVEPFKLAEKYPADTVLRTQYPVTEDRTPDGRTVFKDVIVLGDDGRHASRRA